MCLVFLVLLVLAIDSQDFGWMRRIAFAFLSHVAGDTKAERSWRTLVHQNLDKDECAGRIVRKDVPEVQVLPPFLQ